MVYSIERQSWIKAHPSTQAGKQCRPPLHHIPPSGDFWALRPTPSRSVPPPDGLARPLTTEGPLFF
ncbi:hypothetical protein EYF80_035641 [Liparis tanakae]|uniref:Uncharacterized protein n=1 Tax=Liparis tanakae TaxID=230148 RepID=A0A4Z2GMV9_9TELE|nr:hypothetical protein EYF80_035641 [Liparis tanakae]